MNYRRKHIKPKIRSLRKGNKFYKTPIFWFFLLLIFIVFTFFYFILFYSKLQITEINISGNEKVQNDNLKDLIWSNLDRKILNLGIINVSTKSIFVFNHKEIEKNILRKFPEIEEVKAMRKFPDKINVNVKERRPEALLCNTNQNCFLIDKNGIIFKKVEKLENDLIIKKDTIFSEVLGEIIIDKNLMENILKIKDNLKNNFEINISEVSISDGLVFKTLEGWKIYFDLISDINLQITKMNILLKDEIKESDRKKLQYIYIQYQDRAYYK